MIKLHTFDLEKRTSIFSKDIILLCRHLPIHYVTEPIVKQLIRSTTSIGANYMEANGCDSKKDFKNKIGICKKEAKETCYWIHMLSVALPDKKESLRKYWRECHELVLIFSSIIIKSKV